MKHFQSLQEFDKKEQVDRLAVSLLERKGWHQQGVKYIRDNSWLFILYAILLVIVAFFTFFTEIVPLKGQVMEHHVLPARDGTPRYSTIARFEDGYIRTIDGLDSYLVPVGDTVTIERLWLRLPTKEHTDRFQND